MSGPGGARPGTGGARPGAGRKKGGANAFNAACRAQAARDGVLPLDVMLECMWRLVNVIDSLGFATGRSSPK